VSVRGGDNDARRARVEHLVEANAAAVLAYLARRVASPEDAADLLSETMLVTWRRASAVPADDEDARMWMFVVARNALANHARSTRRKSNLAERLRLELAAAQPESQPNAAQSEARDAVAALPDALRELVTLVHWDGFSVAEASRLSGVSASSGRSRYAKARALLRVHLSSRSAAGADA
jgi:RNA polymerase sigma-70 factor (ECF subfamily)